MDQSLLAKPEELQEQIGGLYSQAQGALDRQANALGDPQPRRDGEDGRRINGDRHNGHDDRRNAPTTASQRRAILAIVNRWDINLDAECREYINEEFEKLSLSQASELIDHLKDQEPATHYANR